MSLGLTATATRAYIDLTDETHRPQTPTLQFPVAPVQLLLIPHDEPPVKRRRVDNALTRRRGLKECLQEQVLPHVSQVVRSLPEGVYYVNNLAVQVWGEV